MVHPDRLYGMHEPAGMPSAQNKKPAMGGFAVLLPTGSINDVDRLVAGAGFEPATFGL